MTLGTLNRGQLMDNLRAFGIENPERHCLEVSDEAIAGVVRWYRHATQQGQRIGGGLIVTKLRNGGLEGFGTEISSVNEWWRSANGRWAWMQEHLPEDQDPLYAEAAIISLVSQKREPNPETVKSLAFELEMDQDAHDEACKGTVKLKAVP